jgi:flagellar FliL protein
MEIGMTDVALTPTDDLRKPRRLPLILAMVASLGLAAAGFLAVRMGLIPGLVDHGEPHLAEQGLPAIAYVPVTPIVVSLNGGGPQRHLRFTAQLEVEAAATEEVQLILPRVLDVLNSYLSAVGVELLESPAALVTIRAQMLRRLQLVAGEGRIRDLLITEFVLN